MSNTARTSSSPSSTSPVTAVVVTLGLVASATIAALALASGTPAGATGLVRFESCEAIAGWVEDLSAEGYADQVDGMPTAGIDDAAAEASVGGNESADTGARSTGGTNTVVEGVDEVDIVDRVSEDRLLVSSSGTLSLVDLDGRRRVATLTGT